jgi:uncharacterized protein (DUF58 family)
MTSPLYPRDRKAPGSNPLEAITHGFGAGFAVTIIFAGVAILASLFPLGRPRATVTSVAGNPKAGSNTKAA